MKADAVVARRQRRTAKEKCVCQQQGSATPSTDAAGDANERCGRQHQGEAQPSTPSIGATNGLGHAIAVALTLALPSLVWHLPRNFRCSGISDAVVVVSAALLLLWPWHHHCLGLGMQLLGPMPPCHTHYSGRSLDRGCLRRDRCCCGNNVHSPQAAHAFGRVGLVEAMAFSGDSGSYTRALRYAYL